MQREPSHHRSYQRWSRLVIWGVTMAIAVCWITEGAVGQSTITHPTTTTGPIIRGGVKQPRVNGISSHVVSSSPSSSGGNNGSSVKNSIVQEFLNEKDRLRKLGDINQIRAAHRLTASQGQSKSANAAKLKKNLSLRSARLPPLPANAADELSLKEFSTTRQKIAELNIAHATLANPKPFSSLSSKARVSPAKFGVKLRIRLPTKPPTKRTPTQRSLSTGAAVTKRPASTAATKIGRMHRSMVELGTHDPSTPPSPPTTFGAGGFVGNAAGGASQSGKKGGDAAGDASQSGKKGGDAAGDASQSGKKGGDAASDASQSGKKGGDSAGDASQSGKKGGDASTDASQSGKKGGDASTNASQSGKKGGDASTDASQSGKKGGQSGKKGGATSGNSGQSGKKGGVPSGDSSQSGKKGGVDGGVLTPIPAPTPAPVQVHNSGVVIGTMPIHERHFLKDRVNPVNIYERNQGDGSTCWANAAAQVYEICQQQAVTQAQFKGPISVDQMVACIKNDAVGGGSPIDALNWLTMHTPMLDSEVKAGKPIVCPPEVPLVEGVSFTVTLPNHFCITGDCSQAAGPAGRYEDWIDSQIIEMRMEFLVYVDASQWQTYHHPPVGDLGDIASIAYPTSACSFDPKMGNHVVLVVGAVRDLKTQKKYWKLLNSWGDQWGVGGYIYLEWGVNACGIAVAGWLPEHF